MQPEAASREKNVVADAPIKVGYAGYIDGSSGQQYMRLPCHNLLF